MPNLLDRVTDTLLRRAAPLDAVPVPPAYARPTPLPPAEAKAASWLLQDPAQPSYITGIPTLGTTYGTEINYAAAAGDLLHNSVVMACIGRLMAIEPDAPFRILRRVAGPDVPLPDHALLQLLRRPNPYYSGLALRQATVLSYNLAGNAYWLKVRNARGRVVELWYEPHYSIRTVAPPDGSAWLTGYQVYRPIGMAGPGAVLGPGGQYWGWVDWPLEDVIHFRHGLDPTNPRYGLSRLAAALRQVATDNEAARFSYALLRNTGIGSVVIAPKFEGDAWDADTRAAVKANYQRATTGDHRGEALVVSGAMDLHRLSFPPSEMVADGSHREPESRIAALLNTPAEVVGLLVGMEHKTYNNIAEAKADLYEGNLLPYYAVVDDTLTHSLIPDFGDPAREYVQHDTSGVRALAESETEVQQRLLADLSAGVISLDEYRGKRSLPPLEGGLGAVPAAAREVLTGLWARYGQAVGAGLLTPNEAREKLGEPPLVTDPNAARLQLKAPPPPPEPAMDALPAGEGEDLPPAFDSLPPGSNVLLLGSKAFHAAQALERKAAAFMVSAAYQQAYGFYGGAQSDGAREHLVDMARQAETKDGPKPKTGPGARGGTFWIDKNGKVRYGKKPTGRAKNPAVAARVAARQARGAAARARAAVRKAEAAARKLVTTAKKNARAELKAQEDLQGMVANGWAVTGGESGFGEGTEGKAAATAAAQALGEQNKDQIVAVVKVNGAYYVVSKPVKDLQTGPASSAPAKPRNVVSGGTHRTSEDNARDEATYTEQVPTGG